MRHILKKNDHLMCELRGEISDGHVHTYVRLWLNWSDVCMSISAGRRQAHTRYTLPAASRNPSWRISETGPIELLTRVSLLNHSCWDSKPISRASPQASDSSARYPGVPLLCWPSDGRTGNKNRETEMRLWLFKASSPVCCAQRATSAAGSSRRRALREACVAVCTTRWQQNRF